MIISLPSKTQLFALVAMVLAPVAATASINLEPFVEGRAYDKRSGEWLYTEAHFCTASRDACRVGYYTPEGELIVEKFVDYSLNASAPNFTQFDLRYERLVAARLDGQSAQFARTTMPVANWRGVDTALTQFEGSVEATEQLVIDAGFDNYVRSRWEDLAEGDKVRFDFALPSRAASLPMIARRKPATVCEATREQVQPGAIGAVAGEQDLCLEIAPANWLINSFVSPIRLEYDADNRRLLSFAGTSNILNEQGKAYRVYIVYDYPGQDASLTGAWDGKDTGWD